MAKIISDQFPYFYKGKKSVCVFLCWGFKALVGLGFNLPYFRIQKGQTQDVKHVAIKLKFPNYKMLLVIYTRI